MALPSTIRLHIASESGAAHLLTRVEQSERPIGQLLDRLLAIAGKDAPRLRELLARGTLTQGAAYWRWSGIEASISEIEAALAGFPDSDPSLPFAPERCRRAVFGRYEIRREEGERKRLFRRRAFWPELMAVLSAARPAYREYSYSERADLYRAELTVEAVQRLRAAAPLLAYTTLEAAIRTAPLGVMDLSVARA